MSPPAAAPVLIAWTTAPDEPTALAIARAAVAAGAAACAQVSGPITAVYGWEGKVCEEAEYRITFKLAAAKEPQLRALVLRQHPYQVPQWLALKAEQVLPAYADWVHSAQPL